MTDEVVEYTYTIFPIKTIPKDMSLWHSGKLHSTMCRPDSPILSYTLSGSGKGRYRACHRPCHS